MLPATAAIDVLREATARAVAADMSGYATARVTSSDACWAATKGTRSSRTPSAMHGQGHLGRICSSPLDRSGLPTFA